MRTAPRWQEPSLLTRDWWGLHRRLAIVVLRLRNMTAIDATGLQALEKLGEALHASGRTLVLCGAREQPAMLMQAAAFHQHVGERNICPNIEAALQRAAEIHRASAA